MSAGLPSHEDVTPASFWGSSSVGGFVEVRTEVEVEVVEVLDVVFVCEAAVVPVVLSVLVCTGVMVVEILVEVAVASVVVIRSAWGSFKTTSKKIFFGHIEILR